MTTTKWREANKEKMREYRRAYYYRNKEKEITRSLETNKTTRRKIREFLTDYKTEKGCQRCGENHPACLDLHHEDHTKKTINPTEMVSQQWGMERVLKELENCEVLCANCHRKEHFNIRLADREAPLSKSAK